MFIDVIINRLQELQLLKVVTINVVMADSNTMKVHRHGGELKGDFKLREKTKSSLENLKKISDWLW